MPAALLGYFVTARFGRYPAAVWLIGASLVFYGWWNPGFVILLLISIAVNYTVSGFVVAAERRPSLQNWIAGAGIAFNLTALFYYKYLFSILSFIHDFAPSSPTIDAVVLPLGISFFSFTQIGYLIDCKTGVTRDRNILNYVLFVTFFPHLIAGPILHNRDIMPQFADPRTYRISRESMSVGTTIFVIGLAKKVLAADPLSDWVAEGYAHPGNLGLAGAWNVALSYSLQLYFDFSGYSDMAIGLARMMNVRFPRNFESPYKARDVIEYWQRWHVSLTQFLTSYLYTPIAVAVMRWRIAHRCPINRAAQRTWRGFGAMIAMPMLVTMGLAGVWHGSGSTFLIFGLLHGFYLCICHYRRVHELGSEPRTVAATIRACAITYLSVLVAGVFFRAPSVGAATGILAGMTGFHGVDLAGSGLANRYHLIHVAVLYAIVWLAPNTQQIMARYNPVLGEVQGTKRWLTWSPGLGSAAAIGVLAAVATMAVGGTTEFLYFQF